MVIFFFLFFHAAWAEDKISLPPTLAIAQELLVAQGICQPGFAEDVGIQVEPLSRGYELWLVPCAHWARNPAWLAYVKINQPSLPLGYLMKPIFFVSYATHEGLFANNVIHSPQWDASTHTLHSRYYRNGIEFCGSMGKYEWNEGLQNFQARDLRKQDDCTNPQANWEKLIP